jgi:hypothetical protein
MKPLHRLAAFCLCVLLLTGCAGLASALPTIQSALTDSSLVLSDIESVFEGYQATHPITPEVRAEYARLVATANQALLYGGRAVSDLGQVDQGKYDAAFADFRAAYAALTDFLTKQGVTPAGAGLVGSGAPSAPAFPVPRVIGLRIQ